MKSYILKCILSIELFDYTLEFVYLRFVAREFFGAYKEHSISFCFVLYIEYIFTCHIYNIQNTIKNENDNNAIYKG